MYFRFTDYRVYNLDVDAIDKSRKEQIYLFVLLLASHDGSMLWVREDY